MAGHHLQRRYRLVRTLRFVQEWAGRARKPLWLLLLGLLLFSMLPTALASDPVLYGYRDFSYPRGTGGNSEPTGEKPESKLWWNDGYWWASMWSTAGDAYHIFRLDLATQNWVDTGTELDDRSDSRADALWDGQHLYIVSHIFTTGDGESAPSGERGELYRYSYDVTTDAYTRDAGFPIEITRATAEALVLEKDSSGQLWVTWVEDRKVMVNHSLNGNDLQWRDPYVLPVDQADVHSDDVSSIITYNQHVGIMWSNQAGSDEVYFAVHPVGAADDVWTQVRAYSTSADDHINLKSLEADDAGNVFAVIKTSNNKELIVVLVCERNLNRCRNESDWSSYPVYDGTHVPTRPILLIDTSNRELYVVTRNQDENGDNGIYYKTSSMDNIQFPAGIGTPFIKSENETDVNDPTSTKQNLTSTTGLVVLASDGDNKYYLHNYKSLDGSENQYELAVSTVGSGNVTLNPPGGTYDEGTTVSLTATADPGWTFSGWSGDLSGSSNSTTITMDRNKSVTATFVREYSLTIDTVGSGSVTTDPSGGVYREGTEVTLTAQAASGWRFVGWSGDLSGSNNPETIVMDRDKSVTAMFTTAPVYTLNVNTVGSGSVDPPGGNYIEDTTVSLTAEAASGWIFSGWSGDLSGSSNPATIVMDRDKSVTATFVAEYSLTVNTVGMGSVTTVPSGDTYRDGTEVTLTAEADSGWYFVGWSGDLSGSDNPATIIMDADKSITARFALPQYSLNVNTVGSGNVTLDPAGGVYAEGQPITLTVTAAPGWTFAGWSGDLTGMNNPARLVMDADKTVTATFSALQYTMDVTTVGAGQVILDPPGGEYDTGTIVTLTAEPDPGWRFSGWSRDLNGTTNPAQVTMDADKVVKATFVQNEPGIELNISASTMTTTVGQTITYTYVVVNVGEATLDNVTVVDDRLGPVTLDSSYLASGEVSTGRLVYKVRGSDLPGPMISTATATGYTLTDMEVNDSASLSIELTPLPLVYYVPLMVRALDASCCAGGRLSQDLNIVERAVADPLVKWDRVVRSEDY